MAKTTAASPRVALFRQCFVTLGVAINMSAHGMVMGFSAVLLPQLKLPGSLIPITDAQGSWIASILGFALVAGNFIVPSVMSSLGRRTANAASVAFMVAGWVFVLLAGSVPALLAARALQGVSMGMSASLGPVLIGEYTSPRNRGAFLATVSLAIAIGVLTVHQLGAHLTWQHTALVLLFVAFLDLLIVLYSPESPSWYADQARYDDCKKAFRWLRGDEEDDELDKMIQSSIALRENKIFVGQQSLRKKIRTNLAYFNLTMRKKEFYKPIIIMIHVYTLCQWAGANILAAYTQDVFKHVVGDINLAFWIFTLDFQRIISNTCAVFVIKKVKRRTMLAVTVCINIASLVLTAAYIRWELGEHMPRWVGALLIHMHMFSIATGTVPLPFIIAGELFPLEYRSLAGGISVLFLSTNLFITVKTFPFLLSTVGLEGAYALYAVVMAYCLAVSMWLLPETKDRTLQDIEDEFRGRPLSPEEVKSVHSLHSLVMYSGDRRCSSPVI